MKLFLFLYQLLQGVARTMSLRKTTLKPGMLINYQNSGPVLLLEVSPYDPAAYVAGDDGTYEHRHNFIVKALSKNDIVNGCVCSCCECCKVLLEP